MKQGICHYDVYLRPAPNPVISRQEPGFIDVLVAKVKFWIKRAKTRRDLANLSHSQLSDVGIIVDEARREAAKPFWQE